ncbi:hypothetical protein NUW58_g1230 [Xylaria curta]|uniref:Uncharacterized protein n=2 Tax=Xylaria curta TaxID=42375 RepID=A0ACC1P361_9PEZI|nr:hypothetical protein NUW58_g5422 [Xylaria curta]KAJ2995593.1 hypothetical protein NUW58_g1230 [Xylaria curta]
MWNTKLYELLEVWSSWISCLAVFPGLGGTQFEKLRYGIVSMLEYKQTTGLLAEYGIFKLRGQQLPESAPVFCYARNGDIAGILRLFDLGKASLQDHTPSGQSLLHFASEFGHLELFKALAVGGLDLCEYGHGSARPVENMIVLGNRHRRVDIAALQQFYLENDVYREGGLLLHPNEWAYIYELLSFSSPEAVRTILPSAVPRFYERLNLEERIKYCSFDDPDGDPETLLFMMNARCNLSHEDISNLQQKSVCFLAIMAFRYGPMSARGGFYHASPWRKLVREAIPLTEDISFRGIGLDPTFQSREFQNKGLKSNPVLEFLQRIEPLTALFTVLSYFRYEKQEHQAPTCRRDLRKRAQIALRWWLEDLAGCQVSLMEYGRRERRIFLRNEKLKKAWYYGGRGFEHKNNSDACVLERMARLVDFDYGANPGDWRLHWDTEVERYAGEFWSLVEGIVPQL